MARTIALAFARVVGVLLAAYVAARLGDSWVTAWKTNPWGPSVDVDLRGEGMALSLIAGIILCCVPALRFDLIPGKKNKIKTGPLAWSLFYVSACWFYGILATPNSAYGWNPWQWLKNPDDLWTLIPIVAAVPLLAIALANALPNAEDRAVMMKAVCGER